MTLFDLLKSVFTTSQRITIKGIFLWLFDKHSFRAHLDYVYTDDKLKCLHILEAINYTYIAEVPPVYLEFGCHSGRTFSSAVRAARYLKIKEAQFFAFDSFEGLPATNYSTDGYFKAGTFSTSLKEFHSIVRKMAGLKLNTANIVRGFYDTSLTYDIQKRIPKAGVIHIDVDLYSSTVDVLNFIKPLMTVGTVLLFDDWYCFPPGTNKGEARAFSEFCEANPSFAVEEWKTYSTFGKSFFVTRLV